MSIKDQISFYLSKMPVGSNKPIRYWWETMDVDRMNDIFMEGLTSDRVTEGQKAEIISIMADQLPV